MTTEYLQLRAMLERAGISYSNQSAGPSTVTVELDSGGGAVATFTFALEGQLLFFDIDKEAY